MSKTHSHCASAQSKIFILQRSILFPNSQNIRRWVGMVESWKGMERIYFVNKEQTALRAQRNIKILRRKRDGFAFVLLSFESTLNVSVPPLLAVHGVCTGTPRAKVSCTKAKVCGSRNSRCAPNWKHQFLGFNVARSAQLPASKSFASKKIIHFSRVRHGNDSVLWKPNSQLVAVTKWKQPTLSPPWRDAFAFNSSLSMSLEFIHAKMIHI